MGWQFWQRESGPTAVDAALRDLITNKFSLTTVDIDRLSVLRQAGQYVGRPVTRLRVYDPSLLNGELKDVSTYEDLDSQAQAVCFEGHVEKDRSINLIARDCMEKVAITARTPAKVKTHVPIITDGTSPVESPRKPPSYRPRIAAQPIS